MPLDAPVMMAWALWQPTPNSAITTSWTRSKINPAAWWCGSGKIVCSTDQPPEPKTKNREQPRKHGPRFAFKEPTTWGEPDEITAIQHPRWGSVESRRWNDLHARQSVDTWFDVVQVQAHLEKDEPPAPLWLAWQTPTTMHAGIQVNGKTIWLAYQHQWTIEPSIRFHKQRLWWSLPQFQLIETAYHWTKLVCLAVWMQYLVKPLAQDQPLPWQKPQCNLTPGRVKNGLGVIFRAIDNLTLPPKPRGNPPGWPKGKPNTPRERYSVI